MEDPYAEYSVTKRTWVPQMHRRSIPIFNQNYNTPLNFRQGKETKDALEFLPFEDNPENLDDFITANNEEEIADSTIDEIRSFLPVMRLLNKMREESNINDYTYRPSMENFGELLNDFDSTERANDIDVIDLLNNIPRNRIMQNYNNLPERFTLTYNTPENFRAGWESRDLIEEEELPESRIYFDEGLPQESQIEESGSGSHTQQDEIFRELKNGNFDFNDNQDQGEEIFRELKNIPNKNDFYDLESTETEHQNTMKQPAIYTEGGVVYVPSNRVDEGTSNFNSCAK